MAALLAAALAAGAAARAADWPAWLGPNRDGISRETDWKPEAVSAGRVLWRAQLGKGYSAVSTKGDRVFSMGNAGNKDAVWCLNAADGSVVWKHEYDCPAGGSYPGPRATPVLDGDRVFTLSRNGLVFCLDAANGQVLWQRRILADTGAANITWGLSSSALVEGDRVFFNVGQHGVALNKATGELVWKSPAGKGGYATPVPYRQGAVPALAIFGQKALHGVEAATGRELWSFPWETSYDVNAADPIVRDGRIFISSGYNTGATLVDVASGSPIEVWRNKNMRNHFGTSVLIGGYVYGIDGSPNRGGLACVDWKTGEKKWNQNLGFGALMAAGDKLIVLLETGDLVVAAAEPGGYREIARAGKLLGRTCWTMPVLSHGRIYCRNDQGELVCLDAR